MKHHLLRTVLSLLALGALGWGPQPLQTGALILTALWAPGFALTRVAGGSVPELVIGLSLILVSVSWWGLHLLAPGTAPQPLLAGWIGLAWMAGFRRPGPIDAPTVPVAAGLVLVVLTGVSFLVNPTLVTRDEVGLTLPVMGALSASFPPQHPALAGAGFDGPWVLMALVGGIRSTTGLAPPYALVLVQLLGVAVAGAGLARAARLGTGVGAIVATVALLLGGRVALGFRGLADPGQGIDPYLLAHGLDRAITRFSAGDGWSLGPLPSLWGAGPAPWTLAALVLAAVCADGGRLRVGLAVCLQITALLLQPVAGAVGLGTWLLCPLPTGVKTLSLPWRLAGGLVAAAVAGLVLARSGGPWLSLHPVLERWTQDGLPSGLLDLAPLLLLAGWGVALAGSRAAGLAVGLPLVVAAIGAGTGLWSAALLGGLPIWTLFALRAVERVRTGHGWVLLAPVLALFLITPALMTHAAVQDRSAAQRWTREERAMLVRAERSLPADAVLLTAPSQRPVSEEAAWLARPAWLGALSAGRLWQVDPGATRALAVRRLDRFTQLMRSLHAGAFLDSLLVEMAPRPIVFVASSEDLGRYPALLDPFGLAASRFEPIENSPSLKVLLHRAR